jgi:hypothetical protein
MQRGRHRGDQRIVKARRVAGRPFARRIPPRLLRAAVEQPTPDVRVNSRQRLIADRLPAP